MSNPPNLHITRTAWSIAVLLTCLGGVSEAAVPFVASPYAAEFVTTGGELGSPGDDYVPSNGDGTFGPDHRHSRSFGCG